MLYCPHTNESEDAGMRLIFVRHAEPDYSIDSLTAKGRFEAELLSRRLAKLNVKAFYCSPLGRAKDTAAPTLRRMGRTAEIRPWLAEFRGHCFDQEAGRERICWDYKPQQWQGNMQLYDPDAWVQDVLVSGGNVAEIWEETKAGLDALLAEHGYIRDGHLYRCEDNQPDTLVFFCHYGIATAMMAYLLNLSPLPLWQTMCMLPSSVTTLISEERVKGQIAWRCSQYGDQSHLYAAEEPASTAAMYHEIYDGYDTTDPIEWIVQPKEEGPLFTD